VESVKSVVRPPAAFRFKPEEPIISVGVGIRIGIAPLFPSLCVLCGEIPAQLETSNLKLET
jgi:hypothetical protein